MLRSRDRRALRRAERRIEALERCARGIHATDDHTDKTCTTCGTVLRPPPKRWNAEYPLSDPRFWGEPQTQSERIAMAVQAELASQGWTRV